MAKTLTFLDKSFWITESEANPKHVASVQRLALPKGKLGEDYVPNLYQELKGFSRACPPFNCKVKTLLGYPLGLQPVKKLNMDYHVQLHVVENVTDRIAMDDFCARLHESRLDPDKPLWQYHFIYDAQSHEFMIYARVHHLYGDGATLVRWFQQGYVPQPSTDTVTPVWALRNLRSKGPRVKASKRFWESLWGNVRMVFELFVVLLRIVLKIARINTHYMPVPFSGTRTMLTGQVKAGRAVATMDLDFNRVKALAKLTRASANEVLLTIFDIGVHRMLKEHGHVFSKALYTNMPINLRKPGEKTTGNKIAIVPVELAHNQQDPYLRLQQIVANHRIVKYAAQHASPRTFSNYTVLIQGLALVFEFFKLSDWVKPIANILVSNVPGPSQPLYLKDAKLLSCYPVSTITPGGGVNITLMTYDGVANIGFVCCDKHIKTLQPLTEYCREAFDLLEASVTDPSVSIDDLGEHLDKVPLTVIEQV